MATRVLISGDVQGVGFRWSAAREAEARGVTGTIRNLPDGRVEAVVDVENAAFLDWLRHGPRGARVTGVETSDAPDTGSDGFEIA
jgi:acylphosphatase